MRLEDAINNSAEREYTYWRDRRAGANAVMARREPDRRNATVIHRRRGAV
jgi:hypothetical protein